MENTIIKIEIQITPQQLGRLPLNISHFLELAALNQLGVILSRNTETDIPYRDDSRKLDEF